MPLARSLALFFCSSRLYSDSGWTFSWVLEFVACGVMPHFAAMSGRALVFPEPVDVVVCCERLFVFWWDGMVRGFWGSVHEVKCQIREMVLCLSTVGLRLVYLYLLCSFVDVMTIDPANMMWTGSAQRPLSNMKLDEFSISVFDRSTSSDRHLLPVL